MSLIAEHNILDHADGTAEVDAVNLARVQCVQRPASDNDTHVLHVRVLRWRPRACRASAASSRATREQLEDHQQVCGPSMCSRVLCPAADSNRYHDAYAVNVQVPRHAAAGAGGPA